MSQIISLIDKHLQPYRIRRDEVRTRTCPFCGGGENQDLFTFSVNVDTGAYKCFRGSCHAEGGIAQLAEKLGEKPPMTRSTFKAATSYSMPKSKCYELTEDIIEYFASRCISESTLNAYGVSADEHGNILFPFVADGDIVYVKHRKIKRKKSEPKEWQDENTRPILFGMDLCNCDDPLIITEGEIDALSLYESGVRNVVSVPCGCENLKFIEECWDWLEKFDTITIFGDNDAPGRKMINQMVKRLGESRCKIVEEYPAKPDGTETKDANEILCELGDLALLDVLEAAKEIPVKGLIDLSTVVPEDPTSIPRIKTNVPALDEAIGGMRMGAVTVFTGKPGNGKLLADETPILTRKGWKRHGDLVVGDELVGLNGEWVKVLHVFPKDNANRKVTFSNGEVVYCHENHEWVYAKYHSYKKYYSVETMETKQIQRLLTASSNKKTDKNGRHFTVHPFSVPYTSPLIGDKKELPVHPYVLGAWLGDGTATQGKICSSKEDIVVIETVKNFGYAISSKSIDCKTGFGTYYFKDLSDGLRKCGMCNSRFRIPKRIPEEYLTASIDQRLELLAGLIDTDGCLNASKTGYHFSTSEPELADSFISLLGTFGWRASVWKHMPKVSKTGIKATKESYAIAFRASLPIPCRVDRKKMSNGTRSKRITITNIEECSPQQGNCIMVEGGIYCVGRTMIPTHNSTLAGALLLNAIEQGCNAMAYSGEMNPAEFQNWINLQAAGSDYITLKFDPIKGKQVPVLPQDVEKAIMKWYAGKLFLYNNSEIFESNQAEAILTVFTTAVRRYGCKVFLIDSVMTATSDTDDETKAQGRFLNMIKKFANKYMVHVIVIAHARKLAPGKNVIGQDDIAGNSATVKLAHSAIVVEKPNLRVIKARDSGQLKLIECCYCPDSRRIYQKDTGDMNRFSWNVDNLPMPKMKACDSPDYQVQVGQPEQMF